jgi:hypothetical protein
METAMTRRSEPRTTPEFEQLLAQSAALLDIAGIQVRRLRTNVLELRVQQFKRQLLMGEFYRWLARLNAGPRPEPARGAPERGPNVIVVERAAPPHTVH